MRPRIGAPVEQTHAGARLLLEKCAFCDTELDYIGRYEPASVDVTLARIEAWLRKQARAFSLRTSRARLQPRARDAHHCAARYAPPLGRERGGRKQESYGSWRDFSRTILAAMPRFLFALAFVAVASAGMPRATRAGDQVIAPFPRAGRARAVPAAGAKLRRGLAAGLDRETGRRGPANFAPSSRHSTSLDRPGERAR